MITYSVSKVADCFDEVFGLLDAHYKELSVMQEYPLNPDFEIYRAHDAKGTAKVILCKDDDKVVGYIVFFVGKHLHYTDCLIAVEDIYFLLPEYRKGRTGLKMFMFAEKYLQSIGVNMIKYSTKMHHDNSSLFEYLGFKNTEKVYTKMIGTK